MSNRIESGQTHDTYGVFDAPALSATAQLATLMVENDQNEVASERDAMRAAHDERLAEGAREVADMHAAATSMQTGAFVAASFAVAGGISQFAGAFCDDKSAAAKRLDASSKFSYAMSQPASNYFNGVADNHRADAKQHALNGEQANWAADEARSRSDEAQKAADQTVDRIASMEQDQHAATSALLNRV